MPDQSQKTEQPTPKRLDKARREGQFPTARYFVSGAQFLAAAALLGAWGPAWIESTKQDFHSVLSAAFRPESGPRQMTDLLLALVWRSFRPLLGAGAILVAVTLAAQLGATNLGVSLNKLAPNLQRLNPATRLRDLIRQNVSALGQALILIPVVTVALYFVVRENLTNYLLLPLKSANAGASEVGRSLAGVLWQAALLFAGFGCVDLFRQRRRHQRELRMSKQEIRDELKEVEGNPQLKARIRRLRREVLRRRMMQQVPKATAVIVNPTHYAVALRYELGSMTAPVVVAKGKNYLALRIRQRAIENQVPLVENPPLAQALYRSADVGQEIPAHLYRAVAEILAYIYRMMNRR